MEYCARINPELAGRFYDEIEKLIETVCRQPNLFRVFDPPTRRHFSTVFPYCSDLHGPTGSGLDRSYHELPKAPWVLEREVGLAYLCSRRGLHGTDIHTDPVAVVAMLQLPRKTIHRNAPIV